jgi:hypothetical protein
MCKKAMPIQNQVNLKIDTTENVSTRKSNMNVISNKPLRTLKSENEMLSVLYYDSTYKVICYNQTGMKEYVMLHLNDYEINILEHGTYSEIERLTDL